MKIKLITIISLFGLLISLRGFCDSLSDENFEIRKLIQLNITDNIDNVLGEKFNSPVTKKIKENKQFYLINNVQVDRDLNKVFTSNKIYNDKSAIIKFASAYKADALVRLSINKKNTEIVLSGELVSGKTGNTLFRETFNLTSLEDEKTLEESLLGVVDNLLRKYPIKAVVTGRTNDSIVISAGYESGILNYGIIEISEIVGIRKHPITGEILKYDTEKLGYAKIEKSDEGVSFGKIEKEIKTIKVGSKITSIENVSEEENKKEEKEIKRLEKIEKYPTLGFVSPRVKVGMVNYGYSALTLTDQISLSGLAPGGSINGELWLTKNIILNADVGMSMFSMSGTTNPTVTSATATTVSNLKSDSNSSLNYDVKFGYRLFPMSDEFGTNIKFSFGIQTYNLTMPIATALNTMPRKWSSYAIGVSGEVGILRDLSAEVGVGLGLVNSYFENGLQISNLDSITNATFRVGINKKIRPNFSINAEGEFIILNANFIDKSIVSFKQMSLVTSIRFYF